MKCVCCGGEVGKKLTTFIYEEDDKYLLVEHVPAEICNRCGEKMYSPEITDELMRFARNEFKPVKTIATPVFDFASR